jgi:putative phosphoesterase
VDRFAAIADVHGNRWALEAVLEDISRQGVRHIVNAGDHLFGPLDPAGTADLLIGLNLQSVSGNQDRELINGSPAGHAELSVPHRNWLASLPIRREVAEGILMFHGTPEHDDVYLLESVRTGGVVSLASAEEITARIGAVPQNVLICGHTHISRTVEVSGHLIVNPGSVGLQAYADDLPIPHRMETEATKPATPFSIAKMSAPKTTGAWNCARSITISNRPRAPPIRMAEQTGPGVCEPDALRDLPVVICHGRIGNLTSAVRR